MSEVYVENLWNFVFKVLKPTHECVNRRSLAYMSTVTLFV